jgi:hypothetical protein
MKKVLSIIGGLFLALIVVIGGFFGYAAYQGRGLDVSSKAYVEENVPPILSSWSKDELVKRSSPELLKAIDGNPDQVSQLFRKLSKLGALRSFTNVKGDSQVFYTSEEGKTITAAYTATAAFENGEARITTRLVQKSGHWQFVLFYVNSPILLQ